MRNTKTRNGWMLVDYKTPNQGLLELKGLRVHPVQASHFTDGKTEATGDKGLLPIYYNKGI